MKLFDRIGNITSLFIGVALIVLLVIAGAIGELATALRRTIHLPLSWSIVAAFALSLIIVTGVVSLWRFAIALIKFYIIRYANTKKSNTVPTSDEDEDS